MANDKGCHNCSKRRIICDQTRPQCSKCLRKGLECPGYGVRYRFNKGIASRGKLTGHTFPTDNLKDIPKHTGQTTAQTLLWPDGSTTSVSSPSNSVPDCLDDNVEQSVADTSLSRPSLLDASVGDNSAVKTLAYRNQRRKPISEQTEISEVSLSSSRKVSSQHKPAVPRPLELVGCRTRMLFDYFSNTIAPVMVVLDGRYNGYRDLILPLACEDELVKAAVSVVSMYHLSSQQSELRAPADVGFQSIIQKLRYRTSQTDSLLDVSAWTTIIVLLTGETITGSNNFPQLFKLLQHLAEAHIQSGQESVMHTFLAEQTRMMTLFAQPLLGENAGIVTLCSRPEAYFDFITNAAIFHPDHKSTLGIYKAAIHRACNIYLTRAIRGPPHADTVPDLEALRKLCERIDPGAPGHHTLVWVYFVAAAESSTLACRDFFTMRLQEVFSRTRFHNIPTAIGALQELWRVQGERKWTEVLPEIMPVFII